MNSSGPTTLPAKPKDKGFRPEPSRSSRKKPCSCRSHGSKQKKNRADASGSCPTATRRGGFIYKPEKYSTETESWRKREHNIRAHPPPAALLPQTQKET